MNIKFTSTCLDNSVPNKAHSFFLGKLPTKSKGFPSYNLQSEMSSAVFSERSKFVAEQVANLQSPLSPSSFSCAPTDKTIDNQLFDATASIKILTAQVAMHMDKKMRDKLFSQIDSLHDFNEWNVDDKPVEKSSFATFLKAILQIKPQRHPGLGLSYDGHLIAAWTSGQDRLTTEFLSNDRVRWVLSCNFDGETERAAGETVVSRLYECLIPYFPDHWFLNEKK